MALDFPANPVNGQVYDSYYYDSSMGAWRAQGSGLALNVFTNPTITGGTISGLTSDLAVADGGTGASDPTNARINLGAAATSHQHSGADITSGTVAIANGGTGATILADAQYNLQIPTSPNMLINSTFDIWQRGTSITAIGATATYTADRWYAKTTAGSSSVSQQSTYFMIGSKYSAQTTMQTAVSGSTLTFAQIIETENVRPLLGKTAVFSAYLMNSEITSSFTGNILLKIEKSSTIDAADTSTWTTIATTTVASTSLSTTVWNRFSVNGAIPSDGTAQTLRVTITMSSTVTASAQAIYISQTQFEVGTVPLPFRRNTNSIQAELAACQRYYWRRSGIGFLHHVYYYDASGHAYGIIQFPVEMRKIPSLLVSAISHITLYTAATSYAQSGYSSVDPQVWGTGVFWNGANAASGANGIAKINNAAGWISLDAEL